MKKINRIGTVFVSSVLLSTVARADEDVTNRFTFSARFGLNISAKFKGVSPISRLTPDGFQYNYDDGYVLDDSSGNFGGMTSNWGYDDSSQQVNSQNNTILMSRTTPGASSPRSFDDDPHLGAELAYNHQIGKTGIVRFGFDIAGNYLNLGLKDQSRSAGSRVTHAYGYTPGTTPPTSPDPQTGPFQGTSAGPNFLIFTPRVGSVTNAATYSDKNKFNGDLWGIRLGPTMDFPVSERLNVAVGVGLAVGFLDSEVSWAQTTTVAGDAPRTTRGSGRDFDVLWGGYFGGNISYQIAEDWTLAGGVQFQSLGTYRHSFDGRKVELDLRKSLFVTIGLGYQF